MSFLPSDSSNPFQAPKTRIGEEATILDDSDRSEARRIREDHIYHESSVRSLGMLYYFAAILFLFVTVSVFAVVATDSIPANQKNLPNLPPEMMKSFFLGVGLFYFFMTVLSALLGFGLRRLQVWSRWTVLVLSCLASLGLVVNCLRVMIQSDMIGWFSVGFSLIPVYVVYLMASSKAGLIFSPEYKLIILQTPDVKPRTSLVAKLALVLVVTIILLVLFLGR